MMLKDIRRKVKIAGAGPAGLTAATCLAKAGYDVEIDEARASVGARFIGDFQVLENTAGGLDPLEMLQKIGLSVNFFAQPIKEAVLFDYRLRSQTVSSAYPFGYFIQRGAGGKDPNGPVSLDEGLLQQARAAGVKVNYQRRSNLNEVDIVATGPTGADGLAKEMTFITDSPNKVWVLFDMNCSPGGYAYLFVLNGTATLGCAITRDLRAINRYFDLALARFQEIDPFILRNEKTGYSFMDFTLKPSAVNDQRLYIGEAGGFQDYLFGLGLRYAILTGYFAAQSFISGEGGSGYDALWRRDLGCSQEISLVNRFLYESGGNRGLSHFVKTANGKDFNAYLASWHAPQPWKRFLIPAVKWAWQRNRSTCRHPFSSHWCRSQRQGKPQ